MKVMVTGAGGYIGTRLVGMALKHGHTVIIASRQKPATLLAPWVPFDLSSENPVVLPAAIDVVMHLAANTAPADLSGEHELGAAKRLIKSAQKAGAKFIFVSSQAARADAPTAYGRTKWRIEQEVLSAGGCVVRPGQVYGGELRGLFGMLVKTVRRWPMLPAFVPAPKVQPIHVDDLANGLLLIAGRSNITPDVYNLAAPVPVLFSIFLSEIAKSRLRLWRGFLPVPSVLITLFSIIIGERLRSGLGLSRLNSLLTLPVMETASDLQRLGLTLRPLRSGMHPSGDNRRRCLLSEGRTMLVYVLKQAPDSAVLRRYVRVIEQLRGGQALGLPQVCLMRPIYLSLIDESVWADKTAAAEFCWRMDAATRLAEATPLGAYRFLGLGREQGMLSSLLYMTNAMVSEMFWRILRIFFFPLSRLILSHAKDAA